MKSLTTRHYVYLGALILLALVLASCAGLDLGDIVKVKTPNAIQQTTGLPSTLSLNEAEVEYQNWFNLTQTTGVGGAVEGQHRAPPRPARSAGCSANSRSRPSTPLARPSRACPCSGRRFRHSPASSACSSGRAVSARRRRRRSTRAWRRAAPSPAPAVAMVVRLGGRGAARDHHADQGHVLRPPRRHGGGRQCQAEGAQQGRRVHTHGSEDEHPQTQGVGSSRGPTPFALLQEWLRTAALAKRTRDASSTRARLSLSTQRFREVGQGDWGCGVSGS